MTANRNRAIGSGFTLIELLVVVVIIGILASIAIPSYSNYVVRSKLTDATAQLAEYRVRLEQYFQDNRNYGTASSTCGAAAPTSTYFTFACTVGAAPADTYTATATSKSGQGLGTAAGDYAYSLTQANARATTKFNGSAVTKSCWLVKGGEC
jgi:type IV pilus assembly protein PilE